MTTYEDTLMAQRELVALRAALSCLEGPYGPWPFIKRALKNGRPIEQLHAELNQALDALWVAVVYSLRPIATLDREIGEEASKVFAGNGEVLAMWRVIQQSGLFSDDDRFPTVELFFLAGAFPYEEDAGGNV